MSSMRETFGGFVLGMYEFPRDESEWEKWTRAGINLIRCNNREELDECAGRGVHGWVPVNLILADDDDGSALADKVNALKDHPALAVWEGPDEAIWGVWGGLNKIRRWWKDEPAEERASQDARHNELVRGFARGSAIIRDLDPDRLVWQNEAANAPVDVVARCAPYFDCIGFDYYPVPNLFERPMYLMGPYVRRFRDAAPGTNLWIVEQAFSWSSLNHRFSKLGGGYPTVAEYRNMAWQAIINGANGLLYWGSMREERPAPFLDDLMKVVAEVSALKRFLTAGPVSTVQVRDTGLFYPPVAGCAFTARRFADEVLLAIVNGDGHEVNIAVDGLYGLPAGRLEPLTGESVPFYEHDGKLYTALDGFETRLYLVRL